MTDFRDNEIARLKYQLTIMEQVIALYGNGLLSAPALSVVNLVDGMPEDWAKRPIQDVEFRDDGICLNLSDGYNTRPSCWGGRMSLSAKYPAGAYRYIRALVLR